MGLHVINLSDVGEGVAEAELVEWHVSVGDTVGEDQLLGVVMTDKAAVDVPSSVLGKVVKLCVDVGDVVAVGSDLIHLEVNGDGNAAGLTNTEISSAPDTQSVNKVLTDNSTESSDTTATHASNTDSLTAKKNGEQKGLATEFVNAHENSA